MKLLFSTLILLVSAKSFSATRCQTAYKSQIAGHTENGELILKPDANYLAYAAFYSGQEAPPEYIWSRSCLILSTGKRYLESYKKFKTKCQINTLSEATIIDLKALRDAAQKDATITEEFGMCDAGGYSLSARSTESQTPFALDIVQDCGDRFRRKSEASEKFIKKLNEICGSTKDYDEMNPDNWNE